MNNLEYFSDDFSANLNKNRTRNENSCNFNGKKKNLKDPPLSNHSNLERDQRSFPENAISSRKLFRFADSWDCGCIILGTMASIAHGAALPVMFIFFGDLTSRFVEYGRYQQCSFNYTICFEMNLTTMNASTWALDIEADLKSFRNDSVERVHYFAFLACIVLVLGSLQVYTYSIQSTRRANRLRVEYFRAILRQDASYHDDVKSGELNARLSRDIKKAKDGMGEKVSFVIQYVTMTLSGITIGLVYTWKLGLVSLAIAPLLVLSGALSFIFSDLYSKKELNAYSKADAVAQEAISSIQTVTAFGCQNREIKRYMEKMKGARKASISRGFMSGLGIGLLYISMFGLYGLSFWYGSTLVIAKEISPGELTTSFFGILIASFALGTAGSYLGTFAEAQAAIDNIFKVIDRVPTIDVFSNEGSTPSLSGPIQFSDVTFTYPSRLGSKVLSNVSFSVDGGQTVALVGHSGCGKSTIFNLLLRLYDPDSGEININGRNIRTMRVRGLRESIGVVSQEPVLFATSIAENIRWGKEGITFEEIISAAKKANAYGFIQNLPNKFDTLVGEGGSHLSGGQKQRISIARAIVRNPNILLLDEATSALDSASERAVQEALQEAAKDRTTIIIAHRLSTIKQANKILVLDRGGIVEQGSHEALLMRSGLYAALYRVQEGKLSNSTDDLTKDLAEERENKEKQMISRQSRVVSRSSSSRWNRSISTRILKKQNSLSLIPINYEREAIHRPSLTNDLSSEIQSISELPDDEDSDADFSFLNLLQLNANEWPFIAAGCFFAAIAGAADPVNAIIFAKVLAIFIIPDPVQQYHLAVLYGLIFLALGVASFFAFTTEATLFAKSGIELTLRLRERTFSSILRQEIGFFDEIQNNTGALCNRLAYDAASVQGCTGVRLGLIVKNFSSLGVALGIGFAFSWKLTLVTLGFIPFIILAAIIEMQLIVGDDSNGNFTDDASQVATEAIKNIKTVASLSSERLVLTNYKKKLETARKSRRKSLLIGLGYGFSQCVIFFVSAATFRLGIDLLINDETTFENVFKVLTALFFGAMAVGQNTSFAPDYAEARISAGKLFKLFNRKSKIDPISSDGFSPTTCRGELSLCSVYFHYPGRRDVRVLKGLNIDLDPGMTLALVGQSGCGKSTIVKLLERFYDPEFGRILLDGIDIRDLNLTWLRHQIGIVSQEPVLLNETIKENILCGDAAREVSFDEIMKVSHQANAKKFIENFEKKYETIVGEKGGRLSGGQKQRVAIARALLRDPKILILDEATSALDAESEKLVQEALGKATSGRTTIIIAHRLSTVIAADKIAVIDRGKIVEVGRHKELLEMRGIYYSLYSNRWSQSIKKISSSSSL